MSNVFNWQLGRGMEYPYEAAYPDQQFAFVFNINRCIGCQSCTMACKSTWTFSKGQEYMWWNNVETKPYGGYPQHWDVRTLDLLEQSNPGGQTWAGDPKDVRAPYGEFKGKTIFEAAKTNISPEGAQRALGYLPTDEEWAAPNRFEDHPVGAEKGVKDQYTTRTTEKCVGCFPRIEGRDPQHNGQPMQTRCMAACVGHIRLQGLVRLNPDGTWKEDRYHPLYYLVHVAKVALPLYPQFGTEPNGYYIPPRWVPRPYLKQMFGPGVDAAIEKYSNPDRELLAVLQLFGKDARICHRYEIKEGPKIFETTVRGRKFELYDDTIIGYAQDGTKIIETKVEEPLHLRPEKHANSI